MTSTKSQAIPAPVSNLLAALRASAEKSGVFGPVSVKGAMLVCAAKESASPAEYRIALEGGRVWVSLVTDNRWLSQSIEADLVHTGDKLDDLIDEELVEQGFDRGPLPFEHFRSEDKLFTFRSPLPIDLARADSPESARIAEQCLLAYEAAFRELGDMQASEDDE